MATWDNVVYTTLGLNLMAKLQTGATLEITRAVGGDGHTSTDALTALTEVTARQTLTLSNAVYKGSGQALLPVTLYNRGLTAGYPLRQIGVYATDPDDGEVLMLIAQSEQPDTIPSDADSPDFVINFSFHVALGNAGRINVSYSLTDMATKADYVAYVEQIEGRLGQPGGIATLNSSGKIAQMPTAADVGAITSSWTTVIDTDTVTEWVDDFDDHITPGEVIVIRYTNGALSVKNCPLNTYGILYVLAGGGNTVVQRYEGNNGVTTARTSSDDRKTWTDWRYGLVRPMQPYISTKLSPEAYIVFTCEGITTGAYLFAAHGCYNPNGSRYYRSVYTAVINVACGYRNNEIVMYVKMAPILVSYGFSADDVDNQFKVGFEHMDQYVKKETYNNKIYIQAQKSVGNPVDWSCKLIKLI